MRSTALCDALFLCTVRMRGWQAEKRLGGGVGEGRWTVNVLVAGRNTRNIHVALLSTFTRVESLH